MVVDACWACNFSHVCKKSTVFCVPVFMKLAETQHHYVQTPHTKFSPKSSEKCGNYERKLMYVRNMTFTAPNFTILSSPCPSRPALGLPQPPVGWGLGLLSRG